MKEIGYLYYIYKKQKYLPNEKSRKCKVINKIKDFDEFKYTKFLIEKTGNNLKEQIIAYRQVKALNFLYPIYNLKLDSRHYKIMLKILDASLNFEFLKKEKKGYIIEIKNKVLKRKKKDNIE